MFAADICEDEKPCKNGGICSVVGDTYACTCAAGFQGPSCENGNKRIKTDI